MCFDGTFFSTFSLFYSSFVSFLSSLLFSPAECIAFLWLCVFSIIFAPCWHLKSKFNFLLHLKDVLSNLYTFFSPYFVSFLIYQTVSLSLSLCSSSKERETERKYSEIERERGERERGGEKKLSNFFVLSWFFIFLQPTYHLLSVCEC